MQNNNRYSKYAALVALLISIVGITLGFAAYSNTVQIKARADVRPGTVPYEGGILSTDPDDPTEGPVTPTTTGGATAEPADLTEEGIENILVHFTAPGQTATYSFYGYNNSEFVSYLNDVTFGTKSCTAAANADGSETTPAYVAAACNDIVMYISASSDDFTDTDHDVNGHSLASGSSEPIAVTIEYIGGGATADGNFDVNFGTSTLTYGTVD